MHNLALELASKGHIVSGSDDQIFDPARTRLAAHGLLPEAMGWFPGKINKDIDLVILGMHAREDNPELLAALQLDLKIQSFPEFMYEYAKGKKRVVIAGSHGKTTTTSMVMHILRSAGREFDYLVGAQLEGYQYMVGLTNADIAVFEGDEYTSSPLDMRPKFLHYKPDITIITGIAWDHINVFETHEKYIHQFELLINEIEQNGILIYDHTDRELSSIVESSDVNAVAYSAFDYSKIGEDHFLNLNGTNHRVNFFGEHNFKNLKAAYLATKSLGISDDEFITSLSTMPGPSRRLEKIYDAANKAVFFDFAHAPSKVKATVKAINESTEGRRSGILELHTFSSLNPIFIQEYAGSLEGLHDAAILYNPDTVLAKRMQLLDDEMIRSAFDYPELTILHDQNEVNDYIHQLTDTNTLLLMSSGNFAGLDMRNVDWKSVFHSTK